MSNWIKDHEDYTRNKPIYHKIYGSEDYFWCGKFKSKRDSVLNHLKAVAKNMGYRYRVEKIEEMSKFAFMKTIRYNLWIRKK